MSNALEYEPDPLDDIDPDERPADPLDGPEADALIAADRHARNIARLRRDATTLRAQYLAEQDRIEDWYDRRRSIIDRQIAWHEAPLLSLHARLLAEDRRRKTIHMPHGTLKSVTPSKPKVTVVNPDAFVAWAAADHPTLVHTTSRPDLGELRAAVKVSELVPMFLGDDPDDDGVLVLVDTGETVPGTVATRPVTSYSVLTDDDA